MLGGRPKVLVLVFSLFFFETGSLGNPLPLPSISVGHCDYRQVLFSGEFYEFYLLQVRSLLAWQILYPLSRH